MHPTTTQLAAISRLFSPGVFRAFAKTGRSPAFARLLALSDIPRACASAQTVADAFEAAFAVLKRAGARDEYIYRAAIAQKILLGKHSLRTACMLTEFRAGQCKADLVILNGTATVYEIKSERDSLARIENQIANYKKVFATINVIACERHVASLVRTVPRTVGIMCLSERHRIQTVREAIETADETCPIAILESLRTSEACTVLKSLGIDVPAVPNTQLHAALRVAFAEQSPRAVQSAMVATLKRTRNLSSLGAVIERLPHSLHAAALSIRMKQDEQHRIVEAMTTPLGAALGWA